MRCSSARLPQAPRLWAHCNQMGVHKTSPGSLCPWNNSLPKAPCYSMQIHASSLRRFSFLLPTVRDCSSFPGNKGKEFHRWRTTVRFWWFWREPKPVKTPLLVTGRQLTACFSERLSSTLGSVCTSLNARTDTLVKTCSICSSILRGIPGFQHSCYHRSSLTSSCCRRWSFVLLFITSSANKCVSSLEFRIYGQICPGAKKRNAEDRCLRLNRSTFFWGTEVKN